MACPLYLPFISECQKQPEVTEVSYWQCRLTAGMAEKNNILWNSPHQQKSIKCFSYGIIKKRTLKSFQQAQTISNLLFLFKCTDCEVFSSCKGFSFSLKTLLKATFRHGILKPLMEMMNEKN